MGQNLARSALTSWARPAERLGAWAFGLPLLSPSLGRLGLPGLRHGPAARPALLSAFPGLHRVELGHGHGLR